MQYNYMRRNIEANRRLEPADEVTNSYENFPGFFRNCFRGKENAKSYRVFQGQFGTLMYFMHCCSSFPQNGFIFSRPIFSKNYFK